MIKLIRQQRILIIVSIILALVTSNFTEDIFIKPAADFMNFAVSGQFNSHRIDQKGIPKVYYARLQNEFYNPVYISMYAFYYFDKWSGANIDGYFLKYYKLEYSKIDRLSKKQYLEYFINCADWLVNNIKFKSFRQIEYGVWEYNFPWEIYNLSPPWVSGMAQGVGIQILVRAYKITGNNKYLETAKKALNAFFVEVKDGGVTYKDNNDEWWYEEYAAPNAKKSRVLNGMEHSLIGIYEYYKSTDDKKAKTLLDNGLQSLKNNIGNYDAGWWTYYDSLGLLANRKYHFINIELTRKLYELTGEPMFLHSANKWSGYKISFFMREFIKQKPNYHDIVIFGFNVIGILFLLELVEIFRRILKRNRRRLKNV